MKKDYDITLLTKERNTHWQLGYCRTNVIQIKNKIMRDKHYKLYSYRLSETTKENITDLHRDTELSYNLLFANMIKHYIKKKITKKNKNYNALTDPCPDELPDFE